MRFRVQMVKAVSVLLYAGPLMAGVAGFGWAMVPPFVGLFGVWLALTRPGHWPQTAEEWLEPRAALAATGHLILQTALVVGCFVVGRGVGGVLGLFPHFPALLPLFLSFLALPLVRLLWSPQAGLAQAMIFDEIPDIRLPRRVTVEVMSAIDRLVVTCEEASPAEADLLVDMALDAPDSAARLHYLANLLAEHPMPLHLPLRRALIGWATRPVDFTEGRNQPAALQAAFAAAAGSDDLLRYLLPRALVLLGAAPGRCRQFPAPALLADMALRAEAKDVAEALQALAGLLAQMTGGAFGGRLAGAPVPARAMSPA